VRLIKSKIYSYDKYLIMVTIRDDTDLIICKKSHLKNEEELGRIEVINTEMHHIVKLNNTTLNKVWGSTDIKN
jgi:Ser-tRNA(Ala) deacylase AlaX